MTEFIDMTNGKIEKTKTNIEVFEEWLNNSSPWDIINNQDKKRITDKVKELFSESEKPKKPKNPTEFVHGLSADKLNTPTSPYNWMYVGLIHKASSIEKYDFMIAWDNDEKIAYRYLGHWNDGCL